MNDAIAWMDGLYAILIFTIGFGLLMITFREKKAE